MPMLDVSITLTSPYLVDLFTVQRRQDVVNSFGRSTPLIVQFNSVPGIVKVSGRNDLTTELDNRTQCKGIRVTTRFALRSASLDGAATNWQPDIVIWNGDNFIVKELRDNSNYGQGFVKAECEAFEVVPLPPSPQASLIMNLPATLKQYSPTVVSPTLVTLPGSVTISTLMLFRNGVLITTQNGDYSVSLSGGLVNITLVVPLGVGDFLVAFA